MKVRVPLPSRERLRELFDYCPETGELRWRARVVSDFAHTSCPEVNSKRWNTKFAGKLALTGGSDQYKCGSLFNRKAFAHRVAWKWVTGEEPDQIDHINGDTRDNRLSNLRNVGYAENTKNKRLRCDNASGYPGVRWDPERKRWFAYIRIDGRMRSLGRHKAISDAVSARRAAEVGYGFHPNNGRH